MRRRLLRVGAYCPPPFAAVGRGSLKLNAESDAVRAAAQEARAQGVKLLLLPEAWPQGYSYDSARVWNFIDRDLPTGRPANQPFAPPRRAPATRALSQLALESKAHVGATVLEYHKPSGDVLNTFILARPDGSIHPELSSKVAPAQFETFVFASGAGIPGRSARHLDVPLFGGDECAVRIGVSICNDNYQRVSLSGLADADPDLLVLPHCAMIPDQTLGFPESASVAFQRTLERCASSVGALFERPAVFVNQSGRWLDSEKLPFLWRPLTGTMLKNATFLGGGRIAAQDGTVLAETTGGGVSGLCVADVEVPPPLLRVGSDSKPGDRRHRLRSEDVHDGIIAATSYPNGWLTLPWVMNTTGPSTERVGRWWYARHAAERRELCEAGVADL